MIKTKNTESRCFPYFFLNPIGGSDSFFKYYCPEAKGRYVIKLYTVAAKFSFTAQNFGFSVFCAQFYNRLDRFVLEKVPNADDKLPFVLFALHIKVGVTVTECRKFSAAKPFGVFRNHFCVSLVFQKPLAVFCVAVKDQKFLSVVILVQKAEWNIGFFKIV